MSVGGCFVLVLADRRVLGDRGEHALDAALVAGNEVLGHGVVINGEDAILCG